MLLVNWNIASLKSALVVKSKRGQQSNQVLQQIAKLNPDVIGLQETKLPPNGLTTSQQVKLNAIFPSYNLFFNSSQAPAKTSYSGTLFLVKNTLIPIITKPQLNMNPEIDHQGRIITAEFPNFYLANIYAPHYEVHLNNVATHKLWNEKVADYLNKLQQNKPVIAAGDFIVGRPARKTDSSEQKRLLKTQDPLIKIYQKIGLIDILKMKNKGGASQLYSWWAPNIPKRIEQGFRTDEWLISKALASEVNQAYVMKTGQRRDHAPIILEIF